MFLLQCCLLVDSLIPLSPLKLEIKIIKYSVIFSFYVFYMYGWLQKLINRHVFVFTIFFLQNLTRIYHTISVKPVLSAKTKYYL